MILARGCSSRLLVLAAQGNLRSLLSGLIFAVTAQSALTGALSPVRLAIVRSPAMNVKTLLAAASAVSASGVAGQALSKSIQLPPDAVQLRASSMPGYAKARANSVACHSAEYMLYQPPN